MTPDLNDRLMAVHLANASDTSQREVESTPYRPRHALFALLAALFGWLCVGVITYGIYLLSNVLDLAGVLEP